MDGGTEFRKRKKILSYFLVILGLFPVSQTLLEDSSQCSGKGLETGNSLSSKCEGKVQKYILYDVNAGEGFNLKRDVFVRIGPMMRALNQLSADSKWILVLPPWGNLPHWEEEDYFPWRTFFDVEEIKQYTPVVEFDTFMEEYGLDNDVDMFYQLQHFPLRSPISKSWSENVREVECEARIRLQKTNERFSGSIWQNRLYFKNATCLGMKGDSSNFVKYLMHVQPKSVFVGKAEVILWDQYGGDAWWEARRSLKFAKNLHSTSLNWINSSINSSLSDAGITFDYLGVHIRRGDFVSYRDNSPSLQDIARQIADRVQTLKLSKIFIASDGDSFEMELLESSLKTFTEGMTVNFWKFECRKGYLNGECAVIDQIVCSRARYFIGSAESTFTLRIFEEREILGVDPDFNYEVFCTGKLQCPKSTRWPIR